jgi:hypothetical protein
VLNQKWFPAPNLPSRFLRRLSSFRTPDLPIENIAVRAISDYAKILRGREMIKLSLIAVMALAVTTGSVLAQTAATSNTTSVPTSRGPGLATPGSSGGVIVPGSPVNGTLMNNANGTSSVMVPGHPSGTIPTTR